MRDLLRGERVRLTAMSAADIPALTRWQGDGEFLRLFDAVAAVPKSEAQLQHWLEEAQAARDGYLFGIRLTDDDRLIGYLQIDGILWPHGTAWVSIGIGDAADRGRGYGAEAMTLALAFAFHELNLHRIQLTVFSYNTHAIRSYERIGFTQEGTYREFLERDGARYDMLLYGLLRREWEAGRGKSG